MCVSCNMCVVERARPTHPTLYGNGSMQFGGSPDEIRTLYGSMFEMVKMAMSADMKSFSVAMRRMDKGKF